MKSYPLLLVFAFLLVSWSATAQSSIDVDIANAKYQNANTSMTLLDTEISSLESNPIYAEQQTSDLQAYETLHFKHAFYNYVYESLTTGTSVEGAVDAGMSEMLKLEDHSSAMKKQVQKNLKPLVEEMMTLLSQ